MNSDSRVPDVSGLAKLLRDDPERVIDYTDVLLEALDAEDTERRHTAADTLEELTHTHPSALVGSIDTLLDATEVDPYLGHTIYQALAEIAAVYPDAVLDSIESVYSHLHSSCNNQILGSITVISELITRRKEPALAHRERFAELAADDDPAIRRAAARVLCQLGNEDPATIVPAAHGLKEALLTYQTDTALSLIALSWAAQASPMAVEGVEHVVLDRLTADDFSVKLAATRLLPAAARLHDSGPLLSDYGTIIAELLTDADRAVRQMTVFSVEEIVFEVPKTVPEHGSEPVADAVRALIDDRKVTVNRQDDLLEALTGDSDVGVA